jgi:hypothetical protein
MNELEVSKEHWLKWMPRPLAMMVSAISLLYSGIGISLINGWFIFNGIPTILPPVDHITQESLLVALLGIGALRSVDKRRK